MRASSSDVLAGVAAKAAPAVANAASATLANSAARGVELIVIGSPLDPVFSGFGFAINEVHPLGR
jgi:hypothetical protein